MPSCSLESTNSHKCTFNLSFLFVLFVISLAIVSSSLILSHLTSYCIPSSSHYPLPFCPLVIVPHACYTLFLPFFPPPFFFCTLTFPLRFVTCLRPNPSNL